MNTNSCTRKHTMQILFFFFANRVQAHKQNIFLYSCACTNRNTWTHKLLHKTAFFFFLHSLSHSVFCLSFMLPPLLILLPPHLPPVLPTNPSVHLSFALSPTCSFVPRCLPSFHPSRLTPSVSSTHLLFFTSLSFILRLPASPSVIRPRTL